MPWDNSLNTGKGRSFQELAAKLLGAHFEVSFQLDFPISIGAPAKPHRFDLVSTDQQYIGECKNYAWTETGNMPSAKMGFLNEAVLYLSHVPAEKTRFIVMRLHRHERRHETLVEYYLRTYRHLLGGIRLFEIDEASYTIREHLVGHASEA